MIPMASDRAKERGRDELRIARAALLMTGSDPFPRDRSVEHFAGISDLGTVLAALWIMPNVAAEVAERRDPDEWSDANEATAVLTETVAMLSES
jgi:hypothetical protein